MGLTDSSDCLSEGVTVTEGGGAGLTDSSDCLSEGVTVTEGGGGGAYR